MKEDIWINKGHIVKFEFGEENKAFFSGGPPTIFLDDPLDLLHRLGKMGVDVSPYAMVDIRDYIHTELWKSERGVL